MIETERGLLSSDRPAINDIELSPKIKRAKFDNQILMTRKEVSNFGKLGDKTR